MDADFLTFINHLILFFFFLASLSGYIDSLFSSEHNDMFYQFITFANALVKSSP